MIKLPTPFSVTTRKVTLNNLQKQEYDIAIIGGGITGAGILLDAVARGLKVILFEKQDFAIGTSSRSTKLIHGGLRYLKNLELGLVREVGQERAIVFSNAIHLVRPEKMLLPLFPDGSLNKFTANIGIGVYEWLANVQAKERKSMLDKENTITLEPLLKDTKVTGSALYTEYRCDDARLVIEVLKKAVEKGAEAVNYCEVTDFDYDDKNTIKAIRLKDATTNETYTCTAKKIINAAGPWVDELRKINKSLEKKQLHLTKGVHIVVDKKKLPIQQSIYFDVPGNRMIFAIPRDGIIYLGTTDTDYKQNIDTPNVSAEDTNYLLNCINNLFPSIHLTPSDVLSSWAGLRPLIHEEGKAPSELSRKDELFLSDTGLISIAGGKLTGYRKMAAKAVDIALQYLVKEFPTTHTWKKSNTISIHLSGGDFDSLAHFYSYKETKIGETKEISTNISFVSLLVDRYGTNVDTILDIAFDNYRNLSPSQQPFALEKAAMTYSKEHECVVYPQDYWHQRTATNYFYTQYYSTNQAILDEIASEVFN